MVTCKMALPKSTHRQNPSLKGINGFKIEIFNSSYLGCAMHNSCFKMFAKLYFGSLKFALNGLFVYIITLAAFYYPYWKFLNLIFLLTNNTTLVKSSAKSFKLK